MPRAALTAGQIAQAAEFFSFGTNDLTQMTWAFSRDDVEGSFFSRYIALGIFGESPFETLDVEGVGRLIKIAAAEGRAEFAADLRAFERVGQPGAREVTGAGPDHLRLRGEPAQGRAMQDPRAVPLELGAPGALGRLGHPAVGITRTVRHVSSVAHVTDIPDRLPARRGARGDFRRQPARRRPAPAGLATVRHRAASGPRVTVRGR